MKQLWALLLLLVSVLGVAAEPHPLRTVGKVELGRYLGKWYEIARYPNSFQKDCTEATAEYTQADDGKIRVTNTCRKVGKTEFTSATGVARVEDPVSQAKLKVNFVPGWLRWTGIGNGDYWIIDLDQDYTFAVVSEPARKYLWILSRTPTPAPAVLDGIRKRLVEQGFDLSKLIPSR